jgi:hypothetical protein
MHGTAVHDELPVGPGVAHLLREPHDVRERHVRIQGAVTDKHPGPDRARLRRPDRGQAAVHADHAHHIGPRAGEREDGKPAETEADGGEPAVGLGTSGQGRQSGLRPPRQTLWIIPQPHQARHHALTVTRDAIPEHVTGQDRVTVRGVPPGLALGVIIETGSAMHEQQPGDRARCRIVPGEKAGQSRLLIVIGHDAGRGGHAVLLSGDLALGQAVGVCAVARNWVAASSA